MNWPEVISIVALIISGVAAWYSRRAVREAQKGNSLSRLHALLTLRLHYFELMGQSEHLSQTLRGTAGGKLADVEVGSLETKIRDVSGAIEEYHNELIGRRT